MLARPRAGKRDCKVGEGLKPFARLVRLLVESFGAYRCPCGATSARRYLGPSTGCHRPCDTGEQICPSGETCVNGICEPFATGDGG